MLLMPFLVNTAFSLYILPHFKFTLYKELFIWPFFLFPSFLQPERTLKIDHLPYQTSFTGSLTEAASPTSQDGLPMYNCFCWVTSSQIKDVNMSVSLKLWVWKLHKIIMAYYNPSSFPPRPSFISVY